MPYLEPSNFDIGLILKHTISILRTNISEVSEVRKTKFEVKYYTNIFK